MLSLAPTTPQVKVKLFGWPQMLSLEVREVGVEIVCDGRNSGKLQEVGCGDQ
jgi:hypothetical protein